MGTPLPLNEMHHRHLWALLVTAEHPGRVRYDDTHIYALYKLDPDAVNELYAAGHLRHDGRYLINTETYGKTTQPDSTPCPMTREAQRVFGAYEPPTRRLDNHPQALDDNEHELLKQAWTDGDLPRPQTRTQCEAQMSLHRRALLEPYPEHPGRVRVSAAGLLALGPGHTPGYGGLAGMCATARHRNGAHWSPNRHHAYSALCAPPGAPATTWRRDATHAMNLMALCDVLDERYRDARDALTHWQHVIFDGVPEPLNYNRPEAHQ